MMSISVFSSSMSGNSSVVHIPCSNCPMSIPVFLFFRVAEIICYTVIFLQYISYQFLCFILQCRGIHLLCIFFTVYPLPISVIVFFLVSEIIMSIIEVHVYRLSQTIPSTVDHMSNYISCHPLMFPSYVFIIR